MNIEMIKEVRAKSNGFVEFAHNLKKLGITHFQVDAKTASIMYFKNEETLAEVGAFQFEIGEVVDVDTFLISLNAHQKGEMDFPEWLEKTTQAGIASWEVSLIQKTCTYFDSNHQELYVEAIPFSE